MSDNALVLDRWAQLTNEDKAIGVTPSQYLDLIMGKRIVLDGKEYGPNDGPYVMVSSRK